MKKEENKFSKSKLEKPLILKSKQSYWVDGGIKAVPHNLMLDIRRNKMIYVCLVFIMAFFVIFSYLPMFGIVMAFENFSPVKGVFGSKWIGMENFRTFFGGPFAGRLIRNTIAIGVIDLLVNFPAPIIFALILNEIHAKLFKKVVQTVSYMPYFVSAVVVCGLVVNFTDIGGVISHLLAIFHGGKEINVLTQNSPAFWVVYVSQNLWQGLGYGSIIYLAALSGVDHELYDASYCDGANRWKQTLHVTIPGILPTVILMLILRMGFVFSVGADKILLLYSPANFEYSDVINTYIYRMGLQKYDYGLSTAVGLFNSIIGTFLLLTTNKITKMTTEQGMF